MKTYTVYFSEPVALTYVDQRWNPTIKKRKINRKK